MANNNGHQKQTGSTAGIGFADKPLEKQPETVNVSPDESHSSAERGASQGKSEQKDLNKIRDILFGQQVRTHEQRFERLEQKLEEERDRLRNDFHSQISQLEDRLVEHVDRLSEQIRTETSDRQSADESIRQTLADKDTEINSQLSSLDERLTETRRETLAELKHEVTTLRAEMETKIDELFSNLERESASRTHNIEKEREKLSALFGQMAQQLQGEKT